jgi:hypothetical protein
VQDRWVAVAEREVDDPPVAVADGPQDADELGEVVEEDAELPRALRSEQLDELRILPPWLERGLHGRGGYASFPGPRPIRRRSAGGLHTEQP